MYHTTFISTAFDNSSTLDLEFKVASADYGTVNVTVGGRDGRVTLNLTATQAADLALHINDVLDSIASSSASAVTA